MEYIEGMRKHMGWWFALLRTNEHTEVSLLIYPDGTVVVDGYGEDNKSGAYTFELEKEPIYHRFLYDYHACVCHKVKEKEKKGRTDHTIVKVQRLLYKGRTA